MRCINEEKSPIIEGEIRVKELFEYLNKMNAVKQICMSEDASGVVSKVQYDPATNQLIGIKLPFNKSTGCPVPFTFMAPNVEMIKKRLMMEKSNLVYIVMAQPLDEKIPPFVLQMFGSDSRFDANYFSKRWKHTITELKK